MKSILSMIIILSFIISCLGASVINVKWPHINSAVNSDSKIEKRIQNIISKMTLEEKVAQMIQAEIKHISPEEVRTYKLGSILNGGGSFPGNNKYSKVSDWVKLADSYWHASMDSTQGKQAIPIIWGTDAVHGHNNVIGATLFPHNIGLGAANNPNLIEQIGQATAKEVLATGIDWVFAPTVAVVRNDRWGRSYEGYSEKSDIVKAYAKYMVNGLQGKDKNILNQDHVISTVKHFIGDGGTEDGVDQGDNLASEQELLEIHAQGYLSALTAGAQTVMASFNSWQGSKIHGNKYLLTEVLKNKMGFDGFVIGDWNGHGQVSGCTNSSCAQAINAGVDMLMAPEDWKLLLTNTIDQVKSGVISADRINDAVTRILRVKIRAGLFELGAPSTRKYAGDETVVGSTAHRQIARKAVAESLVLLKNKNNILPLAAKSNVLIAGSGADNIGQQSGGWSITWQGTGNENKDFPGATSIYQGISNAIKAGGGQTTLSVEGHYKNKPDAAIVVFGETPYAEGQGDLSDLYYGARSPKDLELLKKLKKENIPTIAVFLTGRPLWINPELNASDAFVVAWLPGTEGAGVADVIIGDTTGKAINDFKGHLSFSWPANAAQTLINDGDQDYQPLFPYGFGLSYIDTDTLGDNLPEVAFPGGQAPGSNGVLSVFSGRTMVPFHNFVGDFKGWKHELSGGVGTSMGGIVSVIAIDKDIQEDARQITFSGTGPANFYYQSYSSMNIENYLQSDGVISLDFRIDQRPTKDVSMLMGLAKLDMNHYLQNNPLKTWNQVVIDLKCFSKNGADFKNFNMPFSIETEGSLKFSIANIEVLAKPKTAPTLKCK